MKPIKTVAMALCAAMGLFTAQPSLMAQADKAYSNDAHAETHADGHADPHAKLVIPDKLEGIMKAIHQHHEELAATVKAKKLSTVHEHAFAIRDLAKALPAKVPAEHKKHIEASVKKISQLAEDLDKSGDAGDQKTTEANLKKMDEALKSVDEMVSM